MKKHTAGLALAAVTGFSVLSATPAFAVTGPYQNCDAAAADGIYNIQRGDYRYGEHLDRGGVDGIGCEDDSKPLTPIETAPPVDPTPEPPMPGQVGRMPVGGANTGITQEPQGSNAGILALGGGLVLAAAAGGTFIVRRRSAQQD
ncbi:excalibur calcium-binding domain-containing protein [Arthrobacter sp. zg-Y820]|uniref:excalibur calcium-binding domain-containing protein n=1 Tax=unclassified Arthrobacter TaxID=235627 RepID=UPI001E3158EF|nr:MULTISPECIES: excalibur calcium-binding domain-containing protein [unclassified Arthrobacter]MCC9197529.1 excalibur calcium-binding domain-containing protein [Arthrobacter sp. zg-Y820]MDK1280396.1 excalibur calcium-binding domain-containing protein [Arthrobacter sp. zg.Y820]MDK1360469.1 excalibur calcium-binding domain-containing protein [Arthrobacter sp. zg-Y1219]WIB09675.1 excalibur calcium-binding domain-containing protein [Arthrobacter sp. zg-Y820]